MFGVSMIRHIREAAKRFVGANKGNVAMIFTIAAIPLISFVGAAIDYSRANAARSAMQSAMDFDSLDAVQGSLQQQDQCEPDPGHSSKLLPRALPNKDATVTNITATYTANNGKLGNTIALTANGTINTDFMRVLGSNFSTLGFGTTSTTAWGNVKMRVALVLDNTEFDGSERQDHRAAKRGRRQWRPDRQAQRARQE